MSIKKKVILILLAAFLLRLPLLFIAHHGDLNNNISWGNQALSRGLKDYYEGKDWQYSAPNQPPLTVLLFTLTSLIWQITENVSWWLNNHLAIFPSGFIWFWESHGMDLLVKLPGVLADVGIGFVIYKYFADKDREKLGLNLMVLWLVNPVAWYNSSIWGQTDSVVNLLGLLAIIYLLQKKLILSLLFLVLSILFKGSLVLFIPIWLVVAVTQKYKSENWIKAIFISSIVVVISSILFHPYWDIFIWIGNLYINRFFPGEIGYLTANAFNFWWLVDSGKTLDSKMYLFLTARAWGLLLTGGFVAWFMWKLKESIYERRLLYIFALTACVSFLFMTRIHERYLYPFFPIATILVGLIPTLLLPYLILSVGHLLNLYYLFWAPGIPALEPLYNYPAFPQLLSVVSILIFVYLLFKFVKLRN